MSQKQNFFHKPQIRFMPEDIVVSIGKAKSVLELALAKKIQISHSCGGMGTCGTCRVFAEMSSGSLPERNSVEQEMAEQRNYARDERLACQLVPQDGLVIEIPE